MAKPIEAEVEDVQVSLQVDVYNVVARAVEEGVAYGLRRAYKHVDDPSQESIAEHVEREVLNALCEVIRFPEEGLDPAGD